MNNTLPPFKATYADLKQSTLGLVLYVNGALIKVDTEYLNPLMRKGYANVSLQVDEINYKRCFKTSVADRYLLNFISKFVNDKEYRMKFLIE